MKSFHLILTVTLASVLAGCNASNHALQLAPPEPPVYKPEPAIVFEKTELTQDALVVNIDKRVDVLFVIDDSASMEKHQLNLSKNIDRFVDQLSAKSKDIDFHIAVTTVHDSVRYLNDNSLVPRTCKDSNGKEELLWEDAGTLKKLKGTDVPEHFVQNEAGYKEVLKETLKVGAQKYIGENGKDAQGRPICARGPEFEDLFTPLMTAVSSSAPKVNEGFRREGAFLVVILVTDAKDASGINADEVYSFLQSATGDRVGGKRKLRVFAVAMNKGDVIGANERQCIPDPSFGWARSAHKSVTIPDHEVIKLARMTGDNKADGESQVLSICSDYGSTLAAFGEKIVRDVVHDVAVKLPYLPDMNKSRPTVSIGDTLLVEHQDWDYNEQTNEILIYSSQVDWSQFKGQQIKVNNYEPVNPDAETTKPIVEN